MPSCRRHLLALAFLALPVAFCASASFFANGAAYARSLFQLIRAMNGDTYAYDSISFPALADVGDAFCRQAFAAQ